MKKCEEQEERILRLIAFNPNLMRRKRKKKKKFLEDVKRGCLGMVCTINLSLLLVVLYFLLRLAELKKSVYFTI